MELERITNNAVGAPLGIPHDATFTRPASSAVTKEYFEKVAESKNLPAPRPVTLVTVPRLTEPQRLGGLEDYAYLYMGVDAEVIAEGKAQRARLNRRGRDTLAD